MRIFYGVMGDHRGHVSRALAVAQEFPGAQVLFAGGGHVSEVCSFGHGFLELPMPSTVLRRGRVDIPATVAKAVGNFASAPLTVRRLSRRMEDFGPDLVLTDYEFYTPLAARLLGISCISLDHQHVLTHTLLGHPKGHAPSRIATCAIVSGLYSFASMYLISSFFRPAPLRPETTKVLPPVLRHDVAGLHGEVGEHVLAYLNTDCPEELLHELARIGREVRVYGTGREPESRWGSLVFLPPSRAGFLEDLATAAFVVAGGGHSLLSEALHLGKPVFCLPASGLYEQLVNAHALHQLGYGDYLEPSALGRTGGVFAEKLKVFTKRLEEYRVAISTADYFGNGQVADVLLGMSPKG